MRWFEVQPVYWKTATGLEKVNGPTVLINPEKLIDISGGDSDFEGKKVFIFNFSPGHYYQAYVVSVVDPVARITSE